MSNKINFRNFLLNEDKYYLGQRVGDVLTALQDLQQNGESMGRRQMTANAQRIVDQIRSVLHSNWSKKEEKYLKSIQKAGVAIARAIEENDDLEEVLPTATKELEQVVSQMGVPVNSLATPPEETEPGAEGGEDQVAEPQGEKEQQPQQQQQPPQQPQQQQPAGFPSPEMPPEPPAMIGQGLPPSQLQPR